MSALQQSALLETPVEERFDRITRLASAVLGVPVALVSLVDDHRQFFKSQHGLPEPWASRRETPLTHSFCQHVVTHAAPLIVRDAREHPLLRDNLAITEMQVVAYAGIPIQASNGQVLGSFCAIDTQPREWTESDVDTLRQLGELLRTELQLREALRDADRAAREAVVAASDRAAIIESSTDGIYTVDTHGRCTLVNPAAAEILGFAPHEVLGRNMHELTHHSHADGSAYPDTECPIFNAFRRGLPCRIDSEVFWRRDRTPFPVEYSSYPILDGDAVRGAVITFVDITERQRARSELESAKAGLELRVAERTRELSAALEQQRELAAYSETVREQERTRIAREVHDELGSLLVALKMDVNWLDKRLSEQPQRAAQAAQEMRDRMRSKCQNMSLLIENAVDNVGRIITDLRPSILDHQGLWAALEWQAGEFVRSSELELLWQTQGELLDIQGPAAMAVFRIFQEMLSNVGRHAAATRLAVHIEGDAGRLEIRVSDNGCGAPLSAFEAATAYGVLGMRERARQFGGRIDIASELGHGSTFSLVLPWPHG